MERYGYIRVSTREQNEARQLDALAEYEVPPGNLYIDKQSGENFKRPAWKRLLRKLRPGDLLIVASIDRLGRNYTEILEQWRRVTKEKGADVLILDMPLLDTRTRNRDLTGVFIADMVLQLLSYVAETERENIRRRQAEGIAAAQARGVRFGRPPNPTPDNFEQMRLAWKNNELSLRQAATGCDMPVGTFYSKIKSLEREDGEIPPLPSPVKRSKKKRRRKKAR